MRRGWNRCTVSAARRGCGLGLFFESARGAAGPVGTGPDVRLNFHRSVPFEFCGRWNGLRLFVEAAHRSACAVGTGLHISLNFHVNSPWSCSIRGRVRLGIERVELLRRGNNWPQVSN